MMSFLTVLHILAALILIFTVIIQGGKGADLGAGFGGASQTVFGSGGTTTFFTKFTAWLAAFFMLSSIGLAYLSAHQHGQSVIPKVAEQSAPTAPEAPGAATTEKAPEAAPANP